MSDSQDSPVITRSNRGQWENSVAGRPELSASYTSREEAIDQGRSIADDLGVAHVVDEADPTGAITDQQDGVDEPVQPLDGAGL